MGIQSLGSVTIRVTPECLKTQADEVSRRLRRVRQLFSETENVIARTRNYWIGEAGAAHRPERRDRGHAPPSGGASAKPAANLRKL